MTSFFGLHRVSYGAATGMKSVLLFGLFILFLLALGLVGSLVAFFFAGVGFSLAVLLDKHPMKWAMYGFGIGVVVYFLIKEKIDEIK